LKGKAKSSVPQSQDWQDRHSKGGTTEDFATQRGGEKEKKKSFMGERGGLIFRRVTLCSETVWRKKYVHKGSGGKDRLLFGVSCYTEERRKGGNPRGRVVSRGVILWEVKVMGGDSGKPTKRSSRCSKALKGI